ncbi:hypothetical protein G9447_03730 [Actinopolyspora sp. BKK1]|nr:hypothetical protein [Actinopolyspora sp. BKK2]NHE75332.1 hypothetical protein [Actinopolyspora sp. BKK1]
MSKPERGDSRAPKGSRTTQQSGRSQGRDDKRGDRSRAEPRRDDRRRTEQRGDRRQDRGPERGRNGKAGHSRNDGRRSAGGGKPPHGTGKSAAGGGRDDASKGDFRKGPARGRGSGKNAAPNAAAEGRAKAPKLPEGADAAHLDPEVRRDFRSLPKMVAEDVGAHVVAAGMLLDSDPEQALEHARYARKKASRTPAAREANGIAAYHVGNWSEALSELRAARRMGGQSHVAIIADCERALGRPQRALDLLRSEDVSELSKDEQIELRIVGAGARRDLGQLEAAVVALQIPELDPQRKESWSVRLFYAYADNLVAAGRNEEAFTWFVHAANADDEETTDAPERLDELVPVLGGPEEAEKLVEQADADVATDTEGSNRDEDGQADTSRDVDLGVWD